MNTVDDNPPGDYIPRGPLNETPGGGFQPEHVRLEALKAVLAGAELGDQDHAYLNWLAVLDDDTCRTIGSIMWRARLAGRTDITTALENIRARIDEALASEHQSRQAALEATARDLDVLTQNAAAGAASSLAILRGCLDDAIEHADGVRELLYALRLARSEVSRLVDGGE